MEKNRLTGRKEMLPYLFVVILFTLAGILGICLGYSLLALVAGEWFFSATYLKRSNQRSLDLTSFLHIVGYFLIRYLLVFLFSIPMFVISSFLMERPLFLASNGESPENGAYFLNVLYSSDPELALILSSILSAVSWPLFLAGGIVVGCIILLQVLISVITCIIDSSSVFTFNPGSNSVGILLYFISSILGVVLSFLVMSLINKAISLTVLLKWNKACDSPPEA